jgi:hypothetical protein
VLINDPEYKRLVLEVAIKFRNNNQTVLKTKRDLAKAETEDVRVAAKILRIANKFAIQLEAAACALGLFGADARLLVWDDVEALVCETNGD